MKSQLKTLRRTLVLALATAALAAPSAQAIEFHTGEAHSTLQGSMISKPVLTITDTFNEMQFSTSLNCSQSSLSGTTSASTQTEWLLTPSFGLCQDVVGNPVDIVSNCVYSVHATAGSGPYTGDTDLCPGGGSLETRITTSSGTCTITLASQSGLSTVDFVNEAGKVKVQWTISKLKVTTSGGLLICGVFNGEHTGHYSGTYLIEAKTTAGTTTTAKVE